MVLVNRERQCLGGSARSMTMIPSDNKAEHINITIAKTHNITNWPIQWVIGQFDEIGQLGCSLHADWPIRCYRAMQTKYPNLCQDLILVCVHGRSYIIK